jgi:hypothetical protein
MQGLQYTEMEVPESQGHSATLLSIFLYMAINFMAYDQWRALRSWFILTPKLSKETLGGRGFNGKAMQQKKHTIPIQGNPITYSVKDVSWLPLFIIMLTSFQFFVGLFVGGIENYARGSTMWMFICGHTIQKLNAFKDLLDSIK